MLFNHITDVPQKTCPKCGETKPATAEYFSRNDQKPDGLQRECKGCNHAYYEANRDRIAERARAYRAAHKEEEAERSRAYYEANKEHVAEYKRVWNEANREHIIEGKRVYCEANRENIAKGKRVWYEANRERVAENGRAYREANKEEKAERKRAYRKANPLIIKAAEQRHRARKVAAEGTHTAADIKAQYKRQHGKCYWCGVKVGKDYHVDHVVPLARGGSNGPENLVIACPTCNMSRGARLPHEWPQGGRLL